MKQNVDTQIKSGHYIVLDVAWQCDLKLFYFLFSSHAVKMKYFAFSNKNGNYKIFMIDEDKQYALLLVLEVQLRGGSCNFSKDICY
jgi:hypothetical protein